MTAVDEDRAFAEDMAGALGALGPVEVRRFFGGYGLRCHGTQFAVVMKGRLYLSADDTVRADLTRRGGEPFSYVARGKEVVVTRYISVPDALLDDIDAVAALVRTGPAGLG